MLPFSSLVHLSFEARQAASLLIIYFFATNVLATFKHDVKYDNISRFQKIFKYDNISRFQKIYGNVYLKTSYMQNAQVHDISSYFILDLGIEFINILKRYGLYGHKKRKLNIKYKYCSGIQRSYDFSHLTTPFLFVQGRLGYGLILHNCLFPLSMTCTIYIVE